MEPDEIQIIREPGELAFHLLGRSNEKARIFWVSIFDLEAEVPVWGFAPAGFVRVRATLGEVTPELVDALAVSDDIDPIEDLSPSDPRHTAEITRRENAGVPIEAFRYGVVPHGFQQSYPENGEPIGLQEGRRYCVIVMGRDGNGRLEFRA